MGDSGEPHCCFTCKKPQVTPWMCETCARAGLKIEVCSARCMLRHERNGRHRKELRIQQAKAIGLDAPPSRRGARVQVKIIRRKSVRDESPSSVSIGAPPAASVTKT
jgi:hypothetical protein